MQLYESYPDPEWGYHEVKKLLENEIEIRNCLLSEIEGEIHLFEDGSWQFTKGGDTENHAVIYKLNIRSIDRKKFMWVENILFHLLRELQHHHNYCHRWDDINPRDEIKPTEESFNEYLENLGETDPNKSLKRYDLQGNKEMAWIIEWGEQSSLYRLSDGQSVIQYFQKKEDVLVYLFNTSSNAMNVEDYLCFCHLLRDFGQFTLHTERIVGFEELIALKKTFKAIKSGYISLAKIVSHFRLDDKIPNIDLTGMRIEYAEFDENVINMREMYTGFENYPSYISENQLLSIVRRKINKGVFRRKDSIEAAYGMELIHSFNLPLEDEGKTEMIFIEWNTTKDCFKVSHKNSMKFFSNDYHLTRYLIRLSNTIKDKKHYLKFLRLIRNLSDLKDIGYVPLFKRELKLLLNDDGMIDIRNLRYQANNFWESEFDNIKISIESIS
ncbi:hypothetical protein [Paenibacillus xylanexedens]|uniref:hypothetical protein n=1 Tax=Paenibacillus xylanexedens TaxID=528191 RepID=UPI0011A07326|nr:hypothetical protein [Paenibacillus xylanexedens]